MMACGIEVQSEFWPRGNILEPPRHLHLKIPTWRRCHEGSSYFAADANDYRHHAGRRSVTSCPNSCDAHFGECARDSDPAHLRIYHYESKRTECDRCLPREPRNRRVEFSRNLLDRWPRHGPTC